MSISGSTEPATASQALQSAPVSWKTVQNHERGGTGERKAEKDGGGNSDAEESNDDTGGLGGWRKGWESGSDVYSDSDLPPPDWNPDAELAQDLDLSKIYEPPSLKFTQTPFTLAQSRPRKPPTTTSKTKGKKSAAPAPAPDVPQQAESSTSGLQKSIKIPKRPPAPKPRRRGPIPAKSARMFEAPEVPAERKKPYARKWNRAEADGWKDATGKPIPTTKATAAKKDPTQPSIVDALDQAEAELKKGKRKGKGKTVTTKAIADGVEDPKIEEGVPKGRKKAAPKKKGEDEEGKGAKTGRKGKTAKTIIEEDEEEDNSIPKLSSKAAGKRKAVISDDDQPGPSQKEKATAARGKGKAKEKGAIVDDPIKFGCLPAGAATNEDYPIVKGIKKQRALPVKQPSANRKAKATAASSDPPPLTDFDKAASEFFDSLNNPSPGNKIPLDRLLPASTTARKPKAVGEDNEDGESIDPEGSDDGDRINGIGDEEEGKEALMSRYFSQQPIRGKSLPNSGPTLVPTPPAGSSTLDPPTITKLTRSITSASPKINQDDTIVADSSSALPYSSPLEKRQVRRQDSQLVHPRPIRAVVPALPNMDKFEKLKEIAEEKGIQAAKREKVSTVPDISSAMRKGYTMARPPMSATRNSRRARSPQPQVESRYTSQPREPARPEFNHDNFRPPAYRKSHPQAQKEEDTVWSTLDTKPKKGYVSAYVQSLVSGKPQSSSGGGSMYSTTTAVSNLPKRSNLFTPKAPPPAPPQITGDIPKFRTKTSTNGGMPYAPQMDTMKDTIDLYKRGASPPALAQRRSTGYAVTGSSPAEETLQGKYENYRVTKRAGTGGYEERPRYMPAMVVPLVPLDSSGRDKGEGIDQGGWQARWKNPQKQGRETAASRPSQPQVRREEHKDGWEAPDRHDSSALPRYKEEMKSSDTNLGGWDMQDTGLGAYAPQRSQSEYDHTHSTRAPGSRSFQQVGSNGRDRNHTEYTDHSNGNGYSNGGSLPAQSQPRSRLDMPMATFIGSGPRSSQRGDDITDHRENMQGMERMGYAGFRSASEVHLGSVGDGRMYGNNGGGW